MTDYDLKPIVNILSESGRHYQSEVAPSEWAEQNRMMTPDVTAVPGKFSYKNSPYMREIADFYAPDNPGKVGALMKGAQIGTTRGVIENSIGWIIRNHPGNILYLVGHAELVSPSMQKIDRMIDSCNIRHLIRSTTQRMRRTKSGDTDKLKEFPNGYLRMGITNHKSLRNESFQYGFIDDYEAMKGATKEAGATDKLVLQRFAAYARKMKVLFMSSPELKQSSNIEPLFELGDQRYWHVPCPICENLIVWHWQTPMKDDPEKMAGMTYELNNGELIPESVGYTCQICGGFFDDRDKMDLLNEGKFIPTAKASRDGWVSWHVSALYAPTFMFGWEHYVRDFLEANPPGGQENEAKMKAFYNLVLGMTYEEKSEAPDATQLQMNVRKYDIGSVPEKMSIKDGNGRVVMLTLACDLNGIVKDARLDWEVVAHTETGSTYSIDHGSIGTFIPREGTRKHKTDREHWTYEHGTQRSVWPLLDEVMNRKYEVDTGRRLSIFATAIDVGHYDVYAWQFIDSRKKNKVLYGVKGEGVSQNPGFRSKHLPVEHNISSYKKGKARDNLYIINVNLVKDDLAANIKLTYDPSFQDTQPAGFMNFPQPSDGKYLYENFFSHYEAEHRINERRADGTVIGTKWVKRKSSAQNHMFDCRIYNMAAKDIFYEQILRDFKVPNGQWTDYCTIILNVGKKK